MKIAVLGGGVTGVSTAYYLARAGHDVTLLDRQRDVALETSFANASQVSPGYAAPWAAPGVPVKAIKWLFARHAPLIINLRPEPAKMRWLLAMLRECTSERYAVNKARMVRLAEYSRDQLQLLRRETGIRYDEGSGGTLQVFRTQRQLDAAKADIDVLTKLGISYEVLDRRGCERVEPGLAHALVSIAGGLRMPGDETGDCYLFTVALSKLARSIGVKFELSTTVQALHGEAGRVEHVKTDRGEVIADAYVVALGSHSPRLTSPLGVRLPIYPVKGYSLTFDLLNADRGPISTLLDEQYKVALTRLGDRVRVGGLAEIAGFDASLNPARRETLERSVTDLFPEAGQVKLAKFWTGHRPMTPDGTPIVGATAISNLFINSGHGTLGWTMACGSARILSDIISGLDPEIETQDLGVVRHLSPPGPASASRI